MSQRAFKADFPPPQPAPPPSNVRSLNPKTALSLEVADALTELSVERRGVIGDVKRNLCDRLRQMTFSKAVKWSAPLKGEEWAALVGTTEGNVNEAIQELVSEGVWASLTGAEARKQGVPRPRSTAANTPHYRLYVENWGNVKVSKPKAPTPIDRARPKSAAAGEGFRLRSGEPLVVPFGVAAEQAELRFDSDDQELLFDPVKIVNDVPVFCISVAKKDTSEEHIRLQQDLLNSDQQAILEGLQSWLAERRHHVSAEFLEGALTAMEWPALDFLESVIEDSMGRAKKNGQPWRPAWLKSTLLKNVNATWPGEKARRERTRSRPKGHCVNCGAPPQARSQLTGLRCMACGGSFDEERAS